MTNTLLTAWADAPDLTLDTAVLPGDLQRLEATAINARIRVIRHIRAALNNTLTLGGLHRLTKAEELSHRATSAYLDALGLRPGEPAANGVIEDLADAAILAYNLRPHSQEAA